MPKEAFQKALQIKTKVEFNHVLNVSRKFGTADLVIRVKKNTLTHPRLGIVISKRNIPLAVRRNQVKRQIRESFRINQRKIVSIDIVVIVNKSMNTMNKKQIRLCIDKQWFRLQRYYAKD